MILKQKEKTIKLATRKKNLFVFNIQIPGKIMLVKRRRKLIYLFNKNPQIRLWYRKLGYASNARILKASKLTNGIDILEKVLIKEKFFFDFKENEKGENLVPIMAISTSRDNSNDFKKIYIK